MVHWLTLKVGLMLISFPVTKMYYYQWVAGRWHFLLHNLRWQMYSLLFLGQPIKRLKYLVTGNGWKIFYVVDVVEVGNLIVYLYCIALYDKELDSCFLSILLLNRSSNCGISGWASVIGRNNYNTKEINNWHKILKSKFQLQVFMASTLILCVIRLNSRTGWKDDSIWI